MQDTEYYLCDYLHVFGHTLLALKKNINYIWILLDLFLTSFKHTKSLVLVSRDHLIVINNVEPILWHYIIT